MIKIAITGSKGIIGRVLLKGLKEYQLTPLDLPQNDIRDYVALQKVLKGHDVIIHLAWNTKTENIHSKDIDPDNTLMFSNVYRAAIKSGIKKVIMASSVHASNLIMPYGKHKASMESLGRKYATKGLKVICIRFGNVNKKDKPLDENGEAWLSHQDCVSLIKKHIEKNLKNNFAIIYKKSKVKKH